MRRIATFLGTASILAVMLFLAPSDPRQASALGAAVSVAYAQDDDVVPPRPKPDPACGRVCLEQQGVKYCGYGVGIKGCKSIVNNNCIYVLCPL